ncbi:hypothetical protein H6784_03420 [Candidatus Nomurabacteria bacterium]|nr:hypothetical protein [Candidatus Kaiserbacteria bacterium]MCB9811123.1 hypothetical protein [Candidatus Nomurabacteria bacterium]MCB9814441.1 hypothetical protein [Candidatus Nomurabacteria bacterium]
MANVKAISPQEVINYRKESIPNEVIEVFNELIAENFNGHCAYVRQDEAVKRIVAKGINRNHLFNRGWLDIEDIYRSMGWKVEYDKPAYDESYEASFAFSIK